jgi:hypothetical protein
MWQSLRGVEGATIREYFGKSVPSFDQNVLGLAGPPIARRHSHLDVTVGTDLRHHSRQRTAVSIALRTHRDAGLEPAPAAMRRQSAMMPTRRRTRAQNRSHYIDSQRRHNRNSRPKAQHAAAVECTPLARGGDPPPF